MEWTRDKFIISDDKSKLDIVRIYELLSRTYWASGRSKETILKAIDNSISFGVFCGKQQIGFARAVTDKVVFSWIADVVIDESFRGKGLGKWLVECILDHPDVKNTKQRLATRDAHGLYEQYGFIREDCLGRPRS